MEKVSKIWGYEQIICNTKDYCGKLMFLWKDFRCSVHYHKKKDETFYILKGKVKMLYKNERIVLNKGDFIRIRPNEIHCFTGLEDSVIIEFSTHDDPLDSFRLTESCRCS